MVVIGDVAARPDANAAADAHQMRSIDHRVAIDVGLRADRDLLCGTRLPDSEQRDAVVERHALCKRDLIEVAGNIDSAHPHIAVDLDAERLEISIPESAREPNADAENAGESVGEDRHHATLATPASARQARGANHLVRNPRRPFGGTCRCLDSDRKARFYDTHDLANGVGRAFRAARRQGAAQSSANCTAPIAMVTAACVGSITGTPSATSNGLR